MAISVSVTITGSQQTRKKLLRMGSSINNYSDAFDEIGKDLTKYFSGVAFLSQGGVFGNRWQPLSPAYEESKAKRYAGKGALVASGKMRDNFDHRSRPQSVTIFNKSHQFKYHQSTAPRFKIPRRQTMGVNDFVLSSIRSRIKDETNKKLRTA